MFYASLEILGWANMLQSLCGLGGVFNLALGDLVLSICLRQFSIFRILFQSGMNVASISLRLQTNFIIAPLRHNQLECVW